MADHAPSVAMEAVLKPSCDLPEDMPKIKGYDFNQGVDLQAVLKSYLTTGFQASSLAMAIQEINHMVKRIIHINCICLYRHRNICLFLNQNQISLVGFIAEDR